LAEKLIVAVNVTPLPGVGAEIGGVDLALPLSDAEFAAIRAAYAEHGVIFFRDQAITEAQHLAFARRWARIDINRFLAAHPEHPEIAVLSKEPDQTENIGGAWHTDQSYDPAPTMGSILAARELPARGGDTLFASMYAAYEALPEAMKQKLSTLTAVHSARHVFGKGALYGAARGGRIGNAEAAETLVDAVHPLVIAHPLSGKPALYVNPAYAIRIVELPESESSALLGELFAHCVRADFVYEFAWRPGSIAFWDNRSTWHYAKNDYHGCRRVMHRITLEGEALRGVGA
jgi:taurine dioxygenase